MRFWILAALVPLAGCELIAGVPDTDPLEITELSAVPDDFEPAFDPSVHAYTLHMGDDTLCIISAFINDPKATLELNQMPAMPGEDFQVNFGTEDTGSAAFDWELSTTTGVSTTYHIDVEKP